MYNVPSRFDSPAVDGRTVFTSSRMVPRQLADVIDASTHTGLRDRALLGVLAYTFARIGAVVTLKVEDHYPPGKRFCRKFHLTAFASNFE